MGGVLSTTTGISAGPSPGFHGMVKDAFDTGILTPYHSRNFRCGVYSNSDCYISGEKGIMHWIRRQSSRKTISTLLDMKEGLPIFMV
ncbi:MAG: hypothetical protein QW115_00885 [Thermoplasmata archaeon]